MFRILVRGVALGALGLTLAACSDIVVGGGFPAGSYNRDTITYLAVHGPIPVRTVGNPYDEPQAALTEAVADRFSLPGWFPAATFAPATPEATAMGYHVTFVFNPAVPPDMREVCGAAPDLIPLTVEPGTMRLVAAYCYRGEALNRVSARGPAVEPGSAEFGAMLDEISFALFPDPGPNFWLPSLRRRVLP